MRDVKRLSLEMLSRTLDDEELASLVIAVELWKSSPSAAAVLRSGVETALAVSKALGETPGSASYREREERISLIFQRTA